MFKDYYSDKEELFVINAIALLIVLFIAFQPKDGFFGERAEKPPTAPAASRETRSDAERQTPDNEAEPAEGHRIESAK